MSRKYKITRFYKEFHSSEPLCFGKGVGIALLLIAICLISSAVGSNVSAEEALASAAAPATATPATTAPATLASPKVDKGDTAWILTSAALVLMMTIPGLLLFYGGLVRRKNALGTIMQSFIIVALITIQWVLFGYSLSFGPDIGGVIGGLDWAGLRGVGAEPNADYAVTIPHQAFMVYKLMFAIFTPALITGAFAERAKFSTFIIFILLWATLIYNPLAHWVWGVKGWLREM